MKFKGIELKGIYKFEFFDDWFKVFDGKDNMIYYENSDGDFSKFEYDERGNRVYYEDINRYWEKREYDENSNQTYYENSDGLIIDNKVKELTIEEVEKLLGYKIKIKGE